MTSEEIVDKRVSIAIAALKNVRQLSTDPLMRKIADDAIGEIINVRLAPAPSEAPRKEEDTCFWCGLTLEQHRLALQKCDVSHAFVSKEFYKWWQPKTLIGRRFHGYSENWGAIDAWVAARSEPPAEASREGK